MFSARSHIAHILRSMFSFIDDAPRRFAAMLALTLLFVAGASAQLDIVSPKDSTISTLHSQAVTVRGVPDSSVDLYINGNLVKTLSVRVDGLVDFLNVNVPSGDVRIDVAPAGTPVVPSPEHSRLIHVMGQPAKIHIAFGKEAIPADGVSEITGAVSVRDRWGYAIEKGIVTIGVDSGKIVSKDIDPNTPGIQIALEDSVATFIYHAPRNAGVARIEAHANDISVVKELDLNTGREKFTLVGLATGQSTHTSSHIDVNNLFVPDAFNSGYENSGRVAVYARGTVANDYLMTLSFDSDRRNRDRFFRDIDPDYLYSVYGDNSMLYYDAQSTRNLYAKIERNQSYLFVGDYNTDLTKQEFTMYNRTFNGGKLVLKNKEWNVTGFGTFTDRQVIQTELRGTGLSGFYNIGYTRITIGSEKVRIETRDRFHSESIIRRLDKYRYTDYEIDYDQGTLYFKQPVPAVDEFGNPTYIVVTFEATSNNANQYIAGGRVENSTIPNLTLGVTGVTEQQQPQNYVLLGGDMKYNLNNQFMLGGEIGQSSSLGSPGTAYKLESSVSPSSALSMHGYYRKVQPGFFNITQSGSQSELGTEKYGGSALLQPFSGTKLSGEYYENKQNLQSGLSTVKSFSGSLSQLIFSRFSVNAGAADLRYQGIGFDTTHGPIQTHSTMATGGLMYNLADNFQISALQEQNIGPDKDITQPTGTSIIADYKVSSAVALTASQKFYIDGGGLSTFGVVTTPIEGTNLYGKYELGNVVNEYRNMLSIGLRNTLKLGHDITANLGYERAKSLVHRLIETPTQDHTAYSAGLEYLPKEPVKLTIKGEYGEDVTSKRINIDFGSDYRLITDLSLFGKYRHTEDRAKSNSGFEVRNDLITGIAYRPINADWFNCIGKYEWKTDDNQYIAPYQWTRDQIVSVHAYIEPIRRWESGVKYAFKLEHQDGPAIKSVSHTNFYLIHSKFDLTKWLDIGGEYRLLWQTEARDYLDGYSAEIGVTLIKNFRVAGGYNFKGYKELDLVDYSLWSKGPFVRVDMKFSEELFNMFESHSTDSGETH